MSFQHYPRFHRIILQDKKLRIPKKYVEKYWKEISNPIFLRFPNGVQQEIFWVESNGDILFQKNWNPFAKSLKYGYLLSFKYIGGPYFKVKIFDVDALEVNYSNIKSISEEVIEVSDESEKAKQPQRTRSGKRKVGANRKANDNNPSFKLELTRTYAKGYLFRIPASFSRKYMKEFDGIAMLKIDDHDEDKTWKVIVKYDSVGRNSIVNSGWKIFVKENNLQIDDVCNFELIDKKQLVFNVSFRRANELV